MPDTCYAMVIIHHKNVKCNVFHSNTLNCTLTFRFIERYFLLHCLFKTETRTVINKQNITTLTSIIQLRFKKRFYNQRALCRTIQDIKINLKRLNKHVQMLPDCIIFVIIEVKMKKAFCQNESENEYALVRSVNKKF